MKVHGVEVDGDLKEAVIQALAMDQLPYTVRIHKSRSRDANQWCEQHIGPRWCVIDNRTGTWCCFWAGNTDFEYYLFHFLREEDAVMFGLKWS